MSFLCILLYLKKNKEVRLVILLINNAGVIIKLKALKK